MRAPRHRGHATTWWQGTSNGVANWAAVAIASVLLVIAGGVVVFAMKPAPVNASALSYTAPPAPAPTNKDVALFIGDSYTAGTGASNSASRWTALAAKQLGWSEFNKALGGTGYVTFVEGDGCAVEHCGTYGEAIAGVSDSARPDLVVISGGRNDGSRLTQQSVEETVRAAQSRWPSARVVISSPLGDANRPSAALTNAIEAARAAASSTGVPFLDLGQPLLDHADWVVEDGIHPNDQGHAAIAEAFVSAWRAQNPS